MITIDILLFLLVYDVSISFLSFYSFYVLILRPYFKNRHRHKNGLIVDLSLYNKGIYEGNISFNLSDFIDYMFKEIAEARTTDVKNEDKKGNVNAKIRN